MQYNPTTGEQGIINAVDFYAQTDRESYSLNDVTRNVNKYYKRAVSLIQQVDNNWRWDDRNNLDLPIFTANLANAQPDYVIPDDVRDILRIEVDTEDGVGHKLQRIDQSQVAGSLKEVFEADSLPRYYENIGESVYLYPAPNYNATAGLKIYGKRAGSLFSSSDTTKEPGFDSQYHDYLAIGAAYEYAISPRGDQTMANNLKLMLREMEEEIKRYYSQRGGKKSLGFKRNPKV